MVKTTQPLAQQLCAVKTTAYSTVAMCGENNTALSAVAVCSDDAAISAVAVSVCVVKTTQWN